MQPRHAALLALVAALLGAFIYVVEIRGGADRAADEAKSKRLWPGLEASGVSSLVLTTEEGARAELVREGEAWRITAPLDFPASDSAVESILSGLVGLSREGDVAGSDLAAFGLGDDAPVVAFEAGGARTTLVLGRETPVGSNRYVRIDGAAGEIDFVRAHALTAFSKSLDDLRDSRVLPFETAAVDRARFRWAGAEVALERRDGVWWLVSPIEGLADAERIDTLLADLAYLRAEGFVDADDADDADDANDANDAIDDGDGGGAAAGGGILFEAKLGGAGEPPLDVTFSVAMPDDATDGRIVVRGRDGHRFAVATERLDDWPRRVVDYRDKTLSRFDVAAARMFEIVFHHEGGSEAGGSNGAATETVRIQGELAGRGWVTSPEAMAPARAAALVTVLSRLEGADIVADAMGPDERSALGLEPPHVELRVWGEGASGASAPQLAHVVLGRSRPGRGIYAANAASEVIHLLDESLTTDLPSSYTAFQAEFLEGSDEPADPMLEHEEAEAGLDDGEGLVEPEI